MLPRLANSTNRPQPLETLAWLEIEGLYNIVYILGLYRGNGKDNGNYNILKGLGFLMLASASLEFNPPLVAHSLAHIGVVA